MALFNKSSLEASTKRIWGRFKVYLCWLGHAVRMVENTPALKVVQEETEEEKCGVNTY